MRKLVGLSLVLVAMLVVACGGGAAGPATDVTIEEAWARPSPMAEGMGAGYVRLTAVGGDDKLLSATANVSEVVELHEMAMDGDVMRMRPVEEGYIALPAGETVSLEPGGLHIMFINLNQQLVPGESFDVTLEFEHAGTRTVTLEVRDMDAGGHGGMDGGEMEMEEGEMEGDN